MTRVTKYNGKFVELVDGKTLDDTLEKIRLTMEVKQSKIDELRKELAEYSKEEEVKALRDRIYNLKKRSLMILSEKEDKDARAFREKHYESCKSNCEHIVTATGIGSCIAVKCIKCGVKKDVTDTSNW